MGAFKWNSHTSNVGSADLADSDPADIDIADFALANGQMVTFGADFDASIQK